MRRAMAMLVMTTIVVAGCGAGATPPKPDPVACDPAIERALRAWARAGFSGSIAALTAGEPECLAAYGAGNTADTVFSIGSISKAFTAAAVLDLVDDGKLALDDRAGDLVPGLEGPAARATVEQLLLHTSGLTGTHGTDHEPLGRRQAIEAIGGLEQAFEPGSDFLYSNAGYTLLALIVEETSDTPYREHMVSRILPPGGGFWDGAPAAPGPRAVGVVDGEPSAEMGGFDGPHWAIDGSGDLAMTPLTLATWTHGLFTGRLLSPEAVEILMTPGFERSGGQSETPGWVLYDASVFGQPVFATAGGGGDVGHNAVVAWIPEAERVVAIATNTPRVTAEELLRAVGPAWASGEPLPMPDRPARGVDRAELASAAGTYRLAGGGAFDVAVRGRRLAVSARGREAVAALFPLYGGFTNADAAAHERRVLALLAGETEEGRRERAAIGRIGRVETGGTVVEDGELRTYVRIASGDRALTGWYALNEHGGVEAASIPADPPTLLLAPGGGDRFRPDAPAGGAPDVTAAFDGDRMTVGTVIATR
jgi:CubicO group peptidase (beta-lactamase class C family)